MLCIALMTSLVCAVCVCRFLSDARSTPQQQQQHQSWLNQWHWSVAVGRSRPLTTVSQRRQSVDAQVHSPTGVVGRRWHWRPWHHRVYRRKHTGCLGFSAKTKFLIPKTSDLGDRHFVIRSLYKYSYWCDLTNQTCMSIQVVATAFYCIYMCMNFVHSWVWQLFFKE